MCTNYMTKYENDIILKTENFREKKNQLFMMD